MWQIAGKEIRELLYSFKFLVIAVTGFVLIALSVFNGYAAYKSELKGITVGRQLAEEQLGELEGYNELEWRAIEVIRGPEVLGIFDIGIAGVIGRRSYIGSWNQAQASTSRYAQDPVLALFGELDLTFIVGVVYSLFAVLFGYSAVSGEREKGTLQLIISNPVRRTSVIAGKLIGTYIPLALVYLLPLLLCLACLMLLTDFGLAGDEWGRLAGMVGGHLLYLLVFLNVGLAMSALTRSSFVSFLLCLFLWVGAIAVVPKVTTHIASLVSPSMSAVEMEKRQRDFWDQYRFEYPKQMKKFLQDHPMTEEEFKAKEREFYDTVQEQMKKRNEEFSERLTREYRMKRMNMLGTATLLSSISPTSSMNYTVHSLSNTGPRLLEVFEDSLKVYRKDFLAYAKAMAEKHEKEEEQRKGRWSFGSREDGTIKVEIDEDYQPPKLDLSGMPRFRMILPDAVEMTGKTLPYFGMLAIYALLFFALAYVAFLRYDVR
jgi:ABC-type transport system involved in multi-copper enzyme maturation permease subunit